MLLDISLNLIYLFVFLMKNENSLNTILPSLLPSTLAIICLGYTLNFTEKIILKN